MHKNMGDSDSVMRIIIGLVLLFIAGGIPWALASIGLVLLAALLLYTGFTQACPLYKVFGVDTRAGPGAPRGANGHG